MSLKELREEFLARVKSSREFDWTGGFEPEFLFNFMLSEFRQMVEEMRDNNFDYDGDYSLGLSHLLDKLDEDGK
jgi:hypothetical protein